MYKKAVKRVLFNALVVSLCYQLLNYPLLLWRGAPCGYEGLPSLTTAAMQLLLFAFGVEAGFYYGHRLRKELCVHSPSLPPSLPPSFPKFLFPSIIMLPLFKFFFFQLAGYVYL